MNKTKILAIAGVVLEMLGEARTLPLGGLPSGHIYAALMGHGVTLDAWNAIVAFLVKSKFVEENHHLLTVTAKGIEILDKTYKKLYCQHNGGLIIQ